MLQCTAHHTPSKYDTILSCNTRLCDYIKNIVQYSEVQNAYTGFDFILIIKYILADVRILWIITKFKRTTFKYVTHQRKWSYLTQSIDQL